MLGATAQNLVVRGLYTPAHVYSKSARLCFPGKGFSTKNLCAFLICFMCCNRNREYYRPGFDHPNYI
jgi:hypothetical protein